MDGLSSREEGRLKTYLNEHLVRRRGRWVLDYPCELRWAVMWWGKEVIEAGLSHIYGRQHTCALHI